MKTALLMGSLSLLALGCGGELQAGDETVATSSATYATLGATPNPAPAGSMITVTASGLRANDYYPSLFIDNKYIAPCWQYDPQVGAFSIEVPIPRDVAPGTHTLWLDKSRLSKAVAIASTVLTVQ